MSNELSTTVLPDLWPRYVVFLKTMRSALIRDCEFNLPMWADWLESTMCRVVTDGDARELLRPVEAAGLIRYTEMLCWEVLEMSDGSPL